MSEETKKTGISEEKLEIIVAILLGVTALLTAWATWIGSIHSGNQATNYSTSNNLSAEGNSSWNEASQLYMQDMMTWNTLSSLIIDLSYAEDKNDKDEIARLSDKIDQIIADNCTEEFAEAIAWAMEQEEYASPFEMEGFVDSYYEEALDLLIEADEVLEQGKIDNTHGDSFNLVTVIYSLALFLLGIVGILKKLPNRIILICFAGVIILIATIYMFTLPMPTGFNLGSFFGA